ncbi:uncharacterized protein LOC125033171 [Penaeus chinensis]|uniref:uncharacterized protein LOC125033171 n=1 Tax=Penaeus chinensis TaxID=139456 RepID=UPI001FB79BA6|nr:uncharacterized protein LOC125033171 [Penaeus chinensis]XP_047480479.1 uncharacterized protein LOC125033171 [Penaeus chinensis]XP_047480480.1 uncharacterized protein LOC125033171 [Penaeus chinensis]XP_047480481.1 uncharacterized protein LOC125033171 [Penaeus chinensis]
MADQGFKGSGDGGGESGGGARNSTTMTQVCKSTVMSCPSLEQASLNMISEEMKEILLLNVINSQRVFNEQVKRAVLEAQNRCPGMGTCQGDIKLADCNGQMSTDMRSPQINTCNQQDRLEFISRNEECVSMSFNDKKPLNASTTSLESISRNEECVSMSSNDKTPLNASTSSLESISRNEECVSMSSNDKTPLNASTSSKHDSMSDTFSFDEILPKSSNSDIQEYTYTSNNDEQQLDLNDLSTAGEEEPLNSFSDENGLLTINIAIDDRRLDLINSLQSGVDLNKDCPRDGSASMENGRTDSHLAQSGSNEVSSEPESCVSAYPCCPHMSCMYNQPGKLCTVLGKRFIFTNIEDAPVLIELKLEMLRGHPCGCLLLWRGKDPIPLASLGDGTQIYFDAVVYPNSSRFTCLVVWQGEKPKVSVEPYFDSCVFLCEVKGVNGTLISFEKGMGCVSAVIDGEVKMLTFPPSIFFINGKKVGEKSRIIELLANKDLKVCMNVVKFATAGECVSLCSRVWKGEEPANEKLQIVPNHLTLYRNVQGGFIQNKKQAHLYIDVEANVNMTEDECYLQFNLDGNEISLPWVDKILHVNNKKTKADVTVRRVRAHILRWKSNTNMTAYRFLMVQAYTGRTQQLETDFHKDESKISHLPMKETHNSESDTCMLTLTELSEVSAHVDLDSPESNANKHLSSEVGQTKDLSVVSCIYETKGLEDKALLSEKNLKGKEDEKTKMTEKESIFTQSQKTETHKIQKRVNSISELIIKSQSMEVEKSVKKNITQPTNTEQLGLCNEETLLTNSELVAAKPKKEKEVKIKEKGVKLSSKSKTQNLFLKETSVTQEEPKPLTFQSTLLKIKSKRDKPALLMNHPGTLLWDTSRSVFVICTKIPFGDIKFSIGEKVCYISKGNFTIPAKSPNPIPVMLDAFYIGLSNYRLVALWSDAKPPAARTGSTYYYYEVPGVILCIVDKVVHFHAYLNKDESIIMSAPVPKRVFCSKGDEFTSKLLERFLIRVHLKVPKNSISVTDCQILLMVVMVRDGKPVIIKDILNGRKLTDLKSSSDVTNVFDIKKLSESQALLDHQSTMRDKKITELKDLPEYLRNFTGIIVEKKEMGKVILCQLPREVVFIHFTGFVFVEGCAVHRSKIQCGTVVQFDAFIKKGDVTSEYDAVFVWTGRRVDGFELKDGCRYFFYVSGKYLGKRNRRNCEYKLELDGTVCSYTCQKTGNVILPNGKIGAYPPPESRVSVHLMLKRSGGSHEVVTLFVFVEERIHVSEQPPQGELEIDDSYCIYNGLGELVIMEEDSRALKVATKKTFFLKLSNMQRVFVNSEVKSITDLKEGSLISFDAVHKHNAVLLWIGSKPSFYEHSPDVHYAFSVEGVLVSASQKETWKVQMSLQGQIATHDLNKTGLIYFKDGRNAKNALQVGDSLILHLKITKTGKRTKMIPLFILVTRYENPDRLDLVPQEKEQKLFIKVEDQIVDQPDGKMLLRSLAKDTITNKMILEQNQEATFDSPIKYSIFEGILEKMENGKYQFICHYENQEDCIVLPVDIPLEQTVKQKHFPFYMIIHINTYKEKARSFHPVCGWFKKTAYEVHLLHNLQFESVCFKQKLIGLREDTSGKCSHFSLETPFIYIGKSHVLLHEFTHSNVQQLHAVVKDIPLTLKEDKYITKHILFLTSNNMLSKTALRFLALSEVDHEFDISTHGKQCLTLACAKMFTQPQEEEVPLSHVCDEISDSEGKLTYKNIRILPKPASCITYGMFNTCAVMDSYAVLYSKNRKVIVGRGDLYCGGQKVESHLPLHKVLHVGCGVAAYAIEMKEPIRTGPIRTPDFLISEVAVFAFIGKKPTQSQKIMDEWNLSPGKYLWLPGKLEAKTFTLAISVYEAFLCEKKLQLDPSAAVTVKKNGKAKAQKVQERQKTYISINPKEENDCATSGESIS